MKRYHRLNLRTDSVGDWIVEVFTVKQFGCLRTERTIYKRDTNRKGEAGYNAAKALGEEHMRLVGQGTTFIYSGDPGLQDRIAALEAAVGEL